MSDKMKNAKSCGGCKHAGSELCDKCSRMRRRDYFELSDGFNEPMLKSRRCPFCHEIGEVIVFVGVEEGIPVSDDVKPNVKCWKCGKVIKRDTVEEALKDWNSYIDKEI